MMVLKVLGNTIGISLIFAGLLLFFLMLNDIMKYGL